MIVMEDTYAQVHNVTTSIEEQHKNGHGVKIDCVTHHFISSVTQTHQLNKSSYMIFQIESDNSVAGCPKLYAVLKNIA